MPRDVMEAERPGSACADQPWNVAPTDPGAGRLILRQLHQRLLGKPDADWRGNHLVAPGLELYLPIEQIRIAGRRGRVHTYQRALYGPYLFVRMADDSPAWGVFMEQAGVRGRLRQGKGFAAVGHEAIATLRGLENARGVIPAAQAKAVLAPGQTVRILAGPFTDHTAVIDRPDARTVERIDWRGLAVKERVATQHVLVALFGRETDAEIDERDLEVVDG